MLKKLPINIHTVNTHVLIVVSCFNAFSLFVTSFPWQYITSILKPQNRKNNFITSAVDPNVVFKFNQSLSEGNGGRSAPRHCSLPSSRVRSPVQSPYHSRRWNHVCGAHHQGTGSRCQYRHDGVPTGSYQRVSWRVFLSGRGQTQEVPWDGVSCG